MLYGAEIWGCSRNLEAVDQIQLRACWMFFGVGTLHPRVSLLLEMGDLPMVWLARMRCTLFWFKVLASKVYEGRILRRVAVEAVKYGKGSWMQKMLSCCREFGWQEVGAEHVQNMSEAELKGMLESVEWRRVKAEWSKDLEMKPKLSMLRRTVECGEESSCADVKAKRERRVLLKLRGGTAAFQVETGRWQGVKREDRLCKECTSNEVEDVTHWLLRCPAWNSLRQPLLPEVRSHTEDAEGTAHLLSLACRNFNILSTIMSMWYARFGKF